MGQRITGHRVLGPKAQVQGLFWINQLSFVTCLGLQNDQ